MVNFTILEKGTNKLNIHFSLAQSSRNFQIGEHCSSIQFSESSKLYFISIVNYIQNTFSRKWKFCAENRFICITTLHQYIILESVYTFTPNRIGSLQFHFVIFYHLYICISNDTIAVFTFSM